MDPDSEPPHRKRNQHYSFSGFIFVFLAIAGAAGVSAYAADEPAAGNALPMGLLTILLLCSWAGSALCTVLEHALFVLDSEEMESLALRRPESGGLLMALRKNLEPSWFSLLAGMLVSNLAFALSLGAIIFSLSPGIDALGKTILGLLTVLLVFILGQVLPAIVTARWLETLVPLSARLIQVLVWVLAPLYFVPLMIVRSAGRAPGAMLEERKRILETEKRLLVMVGVGKVEVTFEEEEREMIDHAIGFGENTAGGIMTLRSQIDGVEFGATRAEVLHLVRESPHSRILVYDGSLDNIKGVLHAKQVLLNPDVDYHQFIVPALFVPEDMPLIELIALMKSERRQLVVVLDDYGATAGVLSMNDLLKEIVGGSAASSADIESAELPAQSPHPVARERSLV